MKIILSVLLVILPCVAFAHCPIALEIDGEAYCTAIEWQPGEQKVKGQLQPVSEISPQMVVQGTVPPKWIYSKAKFLVWKDGDKNHVPQKFDNLTIFPYMHMVNGHHHSTSFSFGWDDASQSYEISAVALQEMPGCWSLRWTTSAQTLEESTLLSNITKFNNLSEVENKQVEDFCTQYGDGSGAPTQSGHHHQH